MAHSSGLRIVAVRTLANGATGPANEWVAIANDGPQHYFDHEWELLVEHERPGSDQIFRFPLLIPGQAGWWTFDPGELIFVFTGTGRDTYVGQPTGGRRPQFQFHWGRRAVAWDRPGRRVCLQEVDGRHVTDPFLLPAHPREGPPVPEAHAG